MHILRTGCVAVLVAFAAGAATTIPSDASAAAGATGALGAGGTAKGDISLDAGDEDRITVDLVQGSPLAAKFTSTFPAAVTFTDPNGATIDLGWGTGTTRSVKAFVVPSTGRFTFRVSALSSQGTYSLAASVKWAKKMTVRSAVGQSVVIGLPQGTTFTGRVAAVPAKSWDPVLESLMTPMGEFLPFPVQGAKGVAKLSKTIAPGAGAHTLVVGGGSPGGAFQASFALKVPKVKPTAIDLSNGVTPVKYEADGVRTLLVARCGACHTWVQSAAQAKAHAKPSLSRVKSGNMPQGGQRLDGAEVQLIADWIATGMQQ